MRQCGTTFGQRADRPALIVTDGNNNVEVNNMIDASLLFNVTDPGGNAITDYEFKDLAQGLFRRQPHDAAGKQGDRRHRAEAGAVHRLVPGRIGAGNRSDRSPRQRRHAVERRAPDRSHDPSQREGTA